MSSTLTFPQTSHPKVDSRNGLGYWVSYTDPITIAKTSGNAGSTPMVGRHAFSPL